MDDLTAGGRSPCFVLYGVGSPLVVDYEETCARQNLTIACAIKNVAGPVYTAASVRVHLADEIPRVMLALPFIVPIFTPGRRRLAADDAERHGFGHPLTLLDPTAVIARSTEIGGGTYVNCGAIIGAAGRIGRFVVINRGASIGHHSRIDDFVAVGPGAVIAGNATLGRGVVVGAGAIIVPEITIGNNAVVNAGSVVTKDVSDNCQVGGNPAKVLRSQIPGYNGLAA